MFTIFIELKSLKFMEEKLSGDENAFYGKKHSEETKKILQDKKVGNYCGTQNKKFRIDGILYNSLGDASKKLNISYVTIRHRILSPNPKFSNYKYEVK